MFPEMSEEKKHQCDACDYSAANAKDLATHVKEVHTKPKIYKCPECKHTTSDSSNLRRHINSVHRNIKRYKVGIAFILYVSLIK